MKRRRSYYSGGQQPFKKPRSNQSGMVLFRRPVMGVQARGLPASLTSHRPEIKALDNPIETLTVSNASSIGVINYIRAGSSFCNRIGRKVEMTSVRVSGYFQAIQTAEAPQLARIMLVYDRQTNGAVPALADIIQSTDQAAANSTTILSGMNLNNRDRFTILMDKVLGGTGGDLKNHGFKKFKKISVNTTFNQLNGGNVGDIQTGSLYLLTFLGTNCVTVTAPVTTGRIRLRFMDN